MLQNAGSIASLILTVDCMIANAPRKESPAAPGMGGAAEMY
jgi:chaperonin GroEL